MYARQSARVRDLYLSLMQPHKHEDVKRVNALNEAQFPMCRAVALKWSPKELTACYLTCNNYVLPLVTLR